MTRQSQSKIEAVAASFAEHVRAFHQSLPAEEQVLLEQIFALAEMISGQDGDVQGYAADSFLKIDGIQGEGARNFTRNVSSLLGGGVPATLPAARPHAPA
jgi:hypothetical protein